MQRLTRLVFIFLAVFVALAAAEVQTGVVRSGGHPIPGAAVTAECGADKITTVTDSAGRFELGGLPSTSCNFSIEIFGFETVTRDVTPSSAPVNFDLQLQAHATLPARRPEQRQPEPAPQSASTRPPAIPSRQPGPGRGGFRGQGVTPANGVAGSNGPNRQNAPAAFQNLNLVQNGEAAADSEIPPGGTATPEGTGANPGGANEALLVNGSLSQGIQAQAGDGLGMGGPQGFGRDGFNGPGGIAGAGFGDGAPGIFGDAGGPGGGRGGPGRGGEFGGGGFGGGGRGGFGRGPGRGGPAANGRGQFGNRINRGRGQQWRLSAFYSFGNSALNARPYSFTAPQLINGEQVPKAAYSNNRFGFSAGGPLAVPKLFHSDKTFWFLNYTGQRTKNGIDRISTVPSAAERAGDFSRVPQIIFDPATNAPFPGNIVPASRINTTAAGLLSFIPLPNVSGVRNNFQLIAANPSNSNNLQAVINQTLTTKDRLALNLSYQSRDSATIQNFGFRDPSTGSGLNSSLSYSRTFSRSLINTLGFQFSRNVTSSSSFFSNGRDIEGELGIGGAFVTPLTYGPPVVSFNNFGSLSDALPSFTRIQTAGVTDSLIWIRGKHTVTYGGNFQRRQKNILTNSNARGSFGFTGIATEEIGPNGLPVNGTGYDLADFLIDWPYSSSVNQYLNGNNSFYFRETAASAYTTDDWRIRSGLSLIAGLRWEFFGPYTEKNNRMANLDVAPGYTGVAVVTPGTNGPYSQGSWPTGLIEPRYALFSPRLGVAWKPWKDRQVVIRSGYGIYYTGSVYANFPNRFALEQPFVRSVNITTSRADVLSLENGFSTIPSQTIQNTFAVDRNYKPAYAQSWNFSVQQTFFRNYVLQFGYQGTKGTHLDVLQSPNRAPAGSPLRTQQDLQIPYASTFTYDIAAGNSIYNAAQVSILRRMGRNRLFNLTWVFSKAIDDTSTLGGGVVQMVNAIRAERALSNYDQRHRLSLTYQIQSPVGPDRTSWRWHAIRGWTLNGNFTATSGTPFTATVSGDPSGTGIVGGARAEATGLPVQPGSGYFNPGAFAIPASGTFGNAGRNTIPGIANFSLNASVFRTFRFRERQTITFSINSTNPLNHVNVTGIGTVIGSLNEGLPVAAGGMRTVSAQLRFNY